MTAYTASVTLTKPTMQKLGQVGVVIGYVTLSNYNQTNAEITGITGLFRGGAPIVVLGGVSSLGYLVGWNATDKAIKAWKPGAITDGDVTIGGGSAGAANTALGLTADSTSGALTKAAATARVIPQATLGIAATTQAAAVAEAANDVNVGIVQFVAFGPV